MRAVKLLLLSSLFACAIEHEEDPGGTGSGSGSGGGSGSGTMTPAAITDTQCDGAPDVGPATGFRHTLSEYTAQLAPHHRGIDLIASDTDATQSLTGKIAYGPSDKDLEDEDVELFACLGSQW